MCGLVPKAIIVALFNGTAEGGVILSVWKIARFDTFRLLSQVPINFLKLEIYGVTLYLIAVLWT